MSYCFWYHGLVDIWSYLSEFITYDQRTLHETRLTDVKIRDTFYLLPLKKFRYQSRLQ